MASFAEAGVSGRAAGEGPAPVRGQ
jgi:hypothetical protein